MTATSTAASPTPAAGPLDTLAGAPQREAERAQQAELVRTSFALLKAGRKRAILTGTAWHSAAGGALALEVRQGMTSVGLHSLPDLSRSRLALTLHRCDRDSLLVWIASPRIWRVCPCV